MSTKENVASMETLFDRAASTVWRQFLNMHHRLYDIEGDEAADTDEIPTSVSQASLTAAEREYRGGLDVLCLLGDALGYDTQAPHPHAGHLVFSLKKTEELLIEWAKGRGEELPANLRAPNFRA